MPDAVVMDLVIFRSIDVDLAVGVLDGAVGMVDSVW